MENLKGDYRALDDLPDIITADILANFLHLSKRRVYELMDINPEYGGIPKVQIGRSKRVFKPDFIKWLDQRREVV